MDALFKLTYLGMLYLQILGPYATALRYVYLIGLEAKLISLGQFADLYFCQAFSAAVRVMHI